MLPLPWWILGTMPSEDESDVDETVDDKNAPTLEKQDSIIMTPTPLTAFRTPSASPYTGTLDQLPMMVDYSVFIKGAKRRSSAVLEEDNPKVRKVASRKSGGSEKIDKKKKLERNETEVMVKNDDGFPVTDVNDTFFILDSEFARRDSPMLLNKSDESLADKEILNQSIRDENDNETEFADSSSRDYPMFFTSFNDTTVLFNTTITGDLDTERIQKNEAVGDWVFKGNKFLEENKAGSSKRPMFKEPVKKPKKTREKAKRDTSVESNSSKGSRRRTTKTVEKKETPPSKQAIPGMERRRTPSRKAKTYKSMKED